MEKSRRGCVHVSVYVTKAAWKLVWEEQDRRVEDKLGDSHNQMWDDVGLN